jgi:ribonuclease R
MKKKKVFPDVKLLEMQCKHASDQEKVASEAERASIKYKQVEFMSDKTTQIFKAVVSGVTEYGIFAEIEENLCEGFIRLSNIKSDYFEFDADNYCVTGRRTKKMYRIGDEIFIKVAKANLPKKQLDFELENYDF